MEITQELLRAYDNGVRHTFNSKDPIKFVSDIYIKGNTNRCITVCDGRTNIKDICVVQKRHPSDDNKGTLSFNLETTDKELISTFYPMMFNEWDQSEIDLFIKAHGTWKILGAYGAVASASCEYDGPDHKNIRATLDLRFQLKHFEHIV